MLCVYYKPSKCVLLRCCHLELLLFFFSSSIVAWLLSKFHIAYIVLIAHHMDLVCVRCSWYGFPPICTYTYFVGTVCFKLFESLLCMIFCIVGATKNLFVRIVLIVVNHMLMFVVV